MFPRNEFNVAKEPTQRLAQAKESPYRLASHELIHHAFDNKLTMPNRTYKNVP